MQYRAQQGNKLARCIARDGAWTDSLKNKVEASLSSPFTTKRERDAFWKNGAMAVYTWTGVI